MGLPSWFQPILLAAIVLFGLYTLVEIWRWCSGNRAMLTSGQFARRLTGAIILEIDLLLWFFAGLMNGRPVRERLLYLLVATALVIVPLILAVRETAFILRQYAQWRRELVSDLGQTKPGATKDGS